MYEYKVVPAPVKAARIKGVRGTNNRFSHTLMDLMNTYGQQGWEYVRAETLPCEERSAMGSKSTLYQNVLIFKRAIDADEDAFETQVLSDLEPAFPETTVTTEDHDDDPAEDGDQAKRLAIDV